MPSSVLQRLREHRRKQLEERLNVGPKWRNDFNLVFTARGRRLHDTVVTHMFQKRLDEEGLRRLPFHDLPHSCDTLLQALGVPQRVVMEILGHTTLAMTMERYATALPDARADAARRIDMLLSGKESDDAEHSQDPRPPAQRVRIVIAIAVNPNLGKSLQSMHSNVSAAQLARILDEQAVAVKAANGRSEYLDPILGRSGERCAHALRLFLVANVRRWRRTTRDGDSELGKIVFEAGGGDQAEEARGAVRGVGERVWREGRYIHGFARLGH